jgi:hypothetical protein
MRFLTYMLLKDIAKVSKILYNRLAEVGPNHILLGRVPLFSYRLLSSQR